MVHTLKIGVYDYAKILIFQQITTTPATLFIDTWCL